jgi:hypothetical protein
MSISTATPSLDRPSHAIQGASRRRETCVRDGNVPAATLTLFDRARPRRTVPVLQHMLSAVRRCGECQLIRYATATTSKPPNFAAAGSLRTASKRCGLVRACASVRRKNMRFTIISVVVLIALIAVSETASARSYKWCGLNSATGDRECSFTSRAQCRSSFRQCTRNY